MARKEKKQRTLSEEEKKRLESFEKISADMEEQGYRRRDLIINMNKATWFTIILLFPLLIIGYGGYWLVHGQTDFFHGTNLLVALIAFLVLVVVHELVHGISWSFFTPNHFKDIQFGFMRDTLSPYCTCLVPLKKGQYVFGTVMPLILLGIVPMIVGIVLANPTVLFVGIIMADAAGGDIMILHKLLTFKSTASELVYMDHPTEAGSVVFEKG